MSQIIHQPLARIPFAGSMSIRATRRRSGVIIYHVLLGAAILLAAALRFYNVSALGYVNHYYTAAVRSMLASAHNFFYLAAEPGAAVSVDKPPLGLWLQALSAMAFGVNGFAVLLPQIFAGILSVAVLYRLVRRWCGIPAGLLAALALAVSPVAVAVDRNNTIDSTLVLVLLLAAWAFARATDDGSRRYLLLGAFLIGIGFNIKMLQAFLPLPAFYALYFLGSPERVKHKLANLTLATVVLVAISLSWALAVDLTPADQRPYVGSSEDNTVTELIIGHNGLERLLGRDGARGSSRANLQPDGQRSGQTRGNERDGSDQPGSNPPQQQRPRSGASSTDTTPARSQGSGTGAGGTNIGQPGLFRLFTQPLDNETAWLLPVGLLGIVLLAATSRRQWPLGSRHRALVLWGGWLVTVAVFFSVAGFFHEYYLTMLAAPVAAMAAIGITELWQVRPRQPWVRTVLLLVVAGGTLALQIVIAGGYVAAMWWWAVVGVAALGAALLLTGAIAPRLRWATVTGLCTVVAALFIIPAIWSGLTAANPSPNESLPAAYTGATRQSSADPDDLEINEQLLDYLQAGTQGIEYLVAVPSSMQGADYVIATGRPVLYMGGFKGDDPVIDAEGLAQLVADGRLRYLYWSPRGSGTGDADMNEWVATTCTQVEGFATHTQNAGAPDGTGSSTSQSGGGSMQVELYDCGKPQS